MRILLSVRRVGAVLSAATLLWWVGVTWGVPQLIRAVHAGRLPFLRPLMSAADRTPVEYYLSRWDPFARASTVVLVAAVPVLLGILALVRQRRRRAAGGEGALPPLSSAQLLLVAGWCGLLAGMAEAFYFVSRAFYRREVVPNLPGVSQHAVWMAPLADVLLFLGVGVVLVAASRLSRGRVRPSALVGTLAGLAAFGVVMTTGRLHGAAAGLLALGIAVQVSQSLSPGGGEVGLLARRSAGWLVALVVLLGLAVPVLEMRRERQQLALAGPPEPGAPNVLLIVMDTERAASTTLHDPALRTTPFLAEFAARGVHFSLAIASGSWTLPSHAALLTGRPPRDLGIGWTTPLRDEHATLAEVLSAGGYATAGFMANQYFGGDVFGLDRGFGRWDDQPVSPGTVASHSWLARTLLGHLMAVSGNHGELVRRSADDINSAVLEWVSRPRTRPFFALVNYIDPHAPYLAPEPWNTRFANPAPRYWVDADRKAADYSPSELAELRAAYEGSIAYLDDRLRRLVGALGERGLLANTLVVLTADHGEAFGENGQLEHGSDLDMLRVHVPLVMVSPQRIPAGARVDDPTEIRHVAATVLDLVGLPARSLAGESLARFWRTEAPQGGGAVVTDDGSRTSVITRTHNFLLERDGTERLFDHRLDYLGARNLVNEPTLAAVRDSLRALAKAWRASGQ